jgi:hypothetical protein
MSNVAIHPAVSGHAGNGDGNPSTLRELHDERRRVAAAEARAIAEDSADRAEIRSIQDDIADLRAW